MDVTKDFFVKGLPRDIDLKDAINDLIHNSVEAARRRESNSNNYLKYEITLIIKPNKFIIKDNCGGISKKQAESYVFAFGNNEYKKSEGIDKNHFGIGMKRALFKMGNNINIKSFSDNDYFEVRLDVDKWSKSKDWSIPFSKIGVNDAEVYGTEIEISDIHKDISKEFGKKDFMRGLQTKILNSFKKEIQNGVRININGLNLIEEGEDLERILVKEYKRREYDINVVISKGKKSSELAGWNIFIDNKLIIENNKDSITGWGIVRSKDRLKAPLYEEQYSVFRGELEIKNKNGFTNPLYNTTKSGLNTNCREYEELLEIMVNSLIDSQNEIKDREFINIKYVKPRKEVKLLIKYMGVNCAKDVGIETYDRFLDENKGEFK